jgi:hypothetical protein
MPLQKFLAAPATEEPNIRTALTQYLADEIQFNEIDLTASASKAFAGIGRCNKVG